MQTRKKFVQKMSKVPHPHFYDDVSRVVTSDVPSISEQFSPDMFSLSVNKLNGRNLQPVSLQPLNGLDLSVKMDDMISQTEEIQESERISQKEQELNRKLKELNENGKNS